MSGLEAMIFPLLSSAGSAIASTGSSILGGLEGAGSSILSGAEGLLGGSSSGPLGALLSLGSSVGGGASKALDFLGLNKGDVTKLVLGQLLQPQQQSGPPPFLQMPQAPQIPLGAAGQQAQMPPPFQPPPLSLPQPPPQMGSQQMPPPGIAQLTATQQGGGAPGAGGLQQGRMPAAQGIEAATGLSSRDLVILLQFLQGLNQQA